MIPRIIHQIWFQDNYQNEINLLKIKNINLDRIFSSNIPQKFKKNIIKMFSFNADYYYILWNQETIEKYVLFEPYKKLYYSYDLMIQKIDLAKYLILYLYGGIYIDVDTYNLKCFDKIFNLYPKADLLLSKSVPFNFFEAKLASKNLNCNMKNFINNGILISKKNHYFWILLMQEMIKQKNKNNEPIYNYLFNIKVFNTTGPAIMTNVFQKFNFLFKNTVLLENKFFEPCVGFDPTCVPNKDTITYHQHTSTWYKNSLNGYPFILKVIISYSYDKIIRFFSNIYFTFIRGEKLLLLIIFLLILYKKSIFK